MWLKIVYHLQFAQYVSSILFLLLGWATRVPQHEKLAILVHHLVMVLLVGFCFSVSEYRMGSIIFLTHDLSTPIYEISNMARYIGWTELSNWLYTIYALAFLVTRMVIFPLRVILSIPMHFPASVYYAFTTCGHPAANGGCLSEPLFTINFYYIWLSLLGLLYLTQLHWSVFIAKSTQLSLYDSSKKPRGATSSSTSSSASSSTVPSPSSFNETSDNFDSKPRYRKLNHSQRQR